MVNMKEHATDPRTSTEQSEKKMRTKVLKALVIAPNEKTADLGTLLAIARSEACKREHFQENPVIRTMLFAADLGVYVAIYQVTNHPENDIPKNQMEK